MAKSGVRNLQTVTRALKYKGDSIVNGVKEEILKQTTNIELEAETRKPYGTININHQITDSGLTGIVQAGVAFDDKLAAYYEFGTGAHAAYLVQMYPKEVQALAMTYYKNGQGKLPSTPYLIPAYLRYRKEFISNIRKLIKKNI